jgi:glucokinase
MWAIGIDLGGTKTEAALVNQDGMVLDSIRIKTRAVDGPQAVMDDITDAVRSLITQSQAKPVGIGIGTAGQISKHSGIVEFSPNLKWKNIPLQKSIEDKVNLPVKVTNDVRAITWGEWVFGAGRGFSDIVCLFVGTGIGGGIVSGGKLLEGASNTAGELGHLTVSLNGPECTCGNRGCLETFAGGWGIAQQAYIAVEKDQEKGNFLSNAAGGCASDITSEIVAKCANLGDNLALSIIDTAIDALVAGCISLVNAFNPSIIILGGGVVSGIPEIVQKIEFGVKAFALPSATRDLKIVKSTLGTKAGVIGAASLVMENCLKLENNADKEESAGREDRIEKDRTEFSMV